MAIQSRLTHIFGEAYDRLPEIWLCIKKNIRRGEWISLQKIYEIIQNNLSLDSEDFQPQSPSSDGPKWKRNVRSVLQYRKKTGEVEWDGRAKYRI